MLRIAPAVPPKAPLPPDPDGDAPEDTPAIPMKMHKYDVQKVDQDVARYLSPDQGPFECQNCTHWEDPNACTVVSGDIDPKGTCNLFTSAASQENPDGDPEAEDVTPVEDPADAGLQ